MLPKEIEIKNLQKNIVGIAPNRIINNKIRSFGKLIFITKNPNGTVGMIINRLKLFQDEPDKDILLDLIDKEGSIIEEVTLSKKQFEYLRRMLNLKWDKSII